ncbi:SSF1 [Sanghuangporus vaninii]
MARRRKHRTHVKTPQNTDNNVPRSFIIKHGQVGSSLSQLVRDLRKVMEPNTASRLKERVRNKLKDYLTLAPALHVTHILALTLTPIAPYLRMVRLPAGPTLTFRMERYSLSRDIIGSKKHARSMGLEYLTPPLLVLASFPQPSPSTPPHLTLLMKSFQSLFPPLSPQSLSLSAARRVVLVQYDPERDTVDVRHYLITVKPYGVTRRIRKILEGATKAKSNKSQSRASSKSTVTRVVDLGREQDVADFVLRRRGEPGPDDDGYESAASSASSAAGDDDADAVSLASDYVGRNNKKGTKRAVRLDEIGPRMELRLVKITEGVPGKDGAVMYHSIVKKSKAEATAQKKAHAKKERLRQQRREEQERNVERKKEQAGEGASKKAVQFADEDGEEGDEGEDEREEDVGEWDEEEEISEGEESEQEEEQSESEDEEPVERPKKKRNHKNR